MASLHKPLEAREKDKGYTDFGYLRNFWLLLIFFLYVFTLEELYLVLHILYSKYAFRNCFQLLLNGNSIYGSCFTFWTHEFMRSYSSGKCIITISTSNDKKIAFSVSI